MSFRKLVLAVTLLAIFAMSARISVDTDTWWHLAAGRWMVEQRQILSYDPFSFTRAGEAWTNPSWMSQLLLFGLHQAAGVQGLNLLTALMVTLAFACVWPLLEGPPLVRGFVLVLCATASGVYWSARPQILSFALTGALLLMLEKGRSQARWLAAVPVLLALWANLHGGFAIGLLLIGIELAGEILDALRLRWETGGKPIAGWLDGWRRVARWGVALAASSAAVALNPYGLRMLAYPFATVSIGPLQDLIHEWQSPDFHRPEVWPFLAVLLASLGVLTLSPRRKRARDLLLLSVLSVLALMARRNIALFALGAAPILGSHLWAVVQAVAARRTSAGRQIAPALGGVLNLVILAILAAAAALKVALPLSQERIDEAVAEQQPVRAVTFLEDARPPGPIFNSYAWGGYMIWRLWPDTRTFIDGRTDVFAGDVLDDYVAAWNATERWPEVIRAYDIRLALLERTAPLARALQAGGWEVLYHDAQAVVLAAPRP